MRPSPQYIYVAVDSYQEKPKRDVPRLAVMLIAIASALFIIKEVFI